MTAGEKYSSYFTDATGNVLELVDDTGKRTHTHAYGPTGLPRATTTEAVPQPHRYSGATWTRRAWKRQRLVSSHIGVTVPCSRTRHVNRICRPVRRLSTPAEPCR
ncbi:hypothetical protein [Streptomyces sp. NPDC029041]|uniref:hypothetical protein n=1 Tax=Streptomyces sp. NPDC029041 TaxID=3155727 RepID=UPI003403DD0F